MDNLDKKVIDINYPCIQDVVIRKDETDVCFTITDGQDETKLFLKDGQEVMFTVNIGDVSNIGFGGTDNWGKDRLPLYVEYKKGGVDYDGVFVDTIEIQKLAGDGNWCKCELINDNKSVKYTALSENPYNVTRTAYFYHKTQDDTIKRGYNEGRPASKEWCVTVIQDANPNGKPLVPTPDPIPPIGTDVNIFVKITNKSKNAIALNGELQFLLANPDKEGTYHGWQGVYNRTDAIIFSNSIVTFNSGESKLFENILVPEIGGRSLVTADLAATTKYKTNVLLYGTNNNYDAVPVDNMPSDFYFTNNGTYEIVISDKEAPEPSTGITFDDIIDTMNSVLNANGFKQVSSNGTPNTYKYLKGMYDAALAEWDDPNSKLFSKETYPEIYDYHGDNTEYNEVARTAMLSWVIAMCLTELAPNSGQLTNAQTQYFYKAYNLGGGRNIPLYGDYDMYSDVMIARFAAGAVYALKRGTYSFNEINAFRNEVNGNTINASNWSGLGYYSPDYKSIGRVGYVVNSDAIIPSGPGPYTDDSDPNRPKPFEEGQPDSQFYMEEHSENWYLYNYKKDVEIDDYIVNNFNMGSYTYDPTKGYGEWETYDKEKMEGCFYPGTVLTQRIDGPTDTGYFYKYDDIKVISVDDSFFSKENYSGEIINSERMSFEKEYGVSFDDYRVYKATVAYKSGNNNKVWNRGKVTFKIVVVTVNNKSYILREPDIKETW